MNELVIVTDLIVPWDTLPEHLKQMIGETSGEVRCPFYNHKRGKWNPLTPINWKGSKLHFSKPRKFYRSNPKSLL